MASAWQQQEPLWRLGAFLGTLLLMAAAEALWPRRARARSRRMRWTENLSLSALDTVLVRLIAPAGLTGLALWVEQRGWGLLPRLVPNAFARGVLTFMVLDLVIYAQHVAHHYVPILWRLHRVHHCDEELDATTGVRFHPIEILLSLGIKGATVAALGASPVAVLVFEVALNATSLFNHANWRIPAALDAVIRLIVVTPDVHRVHHSVSRVEQNSNFGFNLPWWDRLFGTYGARPSHPHEVMPLGVSDVPDPGSLWGLIRLPFRRAFPSRKEDSRAP
jgi:sterol desaturase/sphingolipid hydroxylase (fatty acid hydroxylase superfamily)